MKGVLLFFQKNNRDVIETKEPAAFLNCSILDVLGWTVLVVGPILGTVGRFSSIPGLRLLAARSITHPSCNYQRCERVSRKQTERAG